MQVSKHYWKADLKKWKWVPEENAIKESYIAVEKKFTSNELKKCLKNDKLCMLGYFLLGLLVGTIGFLGNVVSGFIFMGAVGILSLGCAMLQYFWNHYKDDYSYYLGEQDSVYETRLLLIFAEELAQLHEEKLQQEALAEKWRKKHPLEEKIRLALTKNPNYIADLLRYCELVKPNKNSVKQLLETEKEQQKKKEEKAKQSIKVRYLGDIKKHED